MTWIKIFYNKEQLQTLPNIEKTLYFTKYFECGQKF